MCAIRPPRSYQVSLEGREACNDAIRGPGHYARVLPFLDRLRAHGVRAHVMLTLHRQNLGEAEGLAAALWGKADRFIYNRLAQVGGGAALEQPTREEYVRFMRRWFLLARRYPFLGFKDNLLNIPRHHFGRRVLGGCTGVGCGAAFNFVALLPDGEIHACRKFPSRLGNALDQGLEAVYASAEAQRYRVGCRECYWCPIRNHCGGCLAVGHGMGRDVFEEPDPHCFFADREEVLAAAVAATPAEAQP
jgi:selenobiotic family peptide radical SAM maturase